MSASHCLGTSAWEWRQWGASSLAWETELHHTQEKTKQEDLLIQKYCIPPRYPSSSSWGVKSGQVPSRASIWSYCQTFSKPPLPLCPQRCQPSQRVLPSPSCLPGCFIPRSLSGCPSHGARQSVANNVSDEQIKTWILFSKDILYKYEYEYYSWHLGSKIWIRILFVRNIHSGARPSLLPAAGQPLLRRPGAHCHPLESSHCQEPGPGTSPGVQGCTSQPQSLWQPCSHIAGKKRKISKWSNSFT